MRLLGLDFETAGTRQVGHFRIVEVGMAVMNTETKRIEQAHGYLVNDLVAVSGDSQFDFESLLDIPEQVTKINKITKEDVFNRGHAPFAFLTDLVSVDLYQVDAIMVWNGYFFDRPLIFDFVKRHMTQKYQGLFDRLREIPWVDLKLDLKLKNKLDHEAADRGILSAYPHMALADVITMLRLFNALDIDLADLIKLSKSEYMIVKAKTGYHQRELPKSQNFRWNPAQKCWWKLMRESEILQEQENWTFETDFITASPEIYDSFFNN